MSKLLTTAEFIYGLDARGGYLIGRATPDGTIAEIAAVAASIEEARRIADELNAKDEAE